jgi:hypothetical protein
MVRCCRELHGDVAAVVVSLRWQNLSMDAQMRALLASAAQRAAAAAAVKGDEGDGYMRRRAQALWGQVRMLADFHRVYRCVPGGCTSSCVARSASLLALTGRVLRHAFNMHSTTCRVSCSKAVLQLPKIVLLRAGH